MWIGRGTRRIGLLSRFHEDTSIKFVSRVDDLFREVEEGRGSAARMTMFRLTSARLRCHSVEDRVHVIDAIDQVWARFSHDPTADPYLQTKADDLRGRLGRLCFDANQFARSVSEWERTANRHGAWGVTIARDLVRAIGVKSSSDQLGLALEAGDALWALWQWCGLDDERRDLRPLLIEGFGHLEEACERSGLHGGASEARSRLASLGAT
jgi:hypothetical protein